MPWTAGSVASVLTIGKRQYLTPEDRLPGVLPDHVAALSDTRLLEAAAWLVEWTRHEDFTLWQVAYILNTILEPLPPDQWPDTRKSIAGD